MSNSSHICRIDGLFYENALRISTIFCVDVAKIEQLREIILVSHVRTAYRDYEILVSRNSEMKQNCIEWFF